MPPILPSGRYIISTVSDTETYHIGPLQVAPDTAVSTLTVAVFCSLLSTTSTRLTNTTSRSTGDWWEKEDGKLFLQSAEPGVKKKWRIFQSGKDKYQLGGEEGTLWSAVSLPPPGNSHIANVPLSAVGASLQLSALPLNGCSGNPSPC
ncbi:hypothetical protein OG21DRAFT_1039884 [Imleria badia]|nr:hypothetical protein OG21DRAFT_1039884 [Imleria badia]